MGLLLILKFQEPYAAYVISLMGIYWMTECIPIPVTSFIPITLFPLFGILASGKIFYVKFGYTLELGEFSFIPDRVTSVYLQDSLLFYWEDAYLLCRLNTPISIPESL